MNTTHILIFAAMAAQLAVAGAQTASTDEVEALRKQVEALTEAVKLLQTQVQEQQRELDNRRTTAADKFAADPYKNVAQPAPEPEASSAAIEELRQDVESLKTSSQQARSGLFNPDISAALNFVTSYSRAADNLNFTVREIELMLNANIDTYARAYMVLNAETELDPTGKTDIFSTPGESPEEAAIVTTSLPWGLEVKGGQFFADFTRMGKVHPHDRPFSDGPGAVDAIIGGETTARGFEVNWRPPIPHYLRITGGVVDNIGAEPPITSTLISLDGDVNYAYADRLNRPFHSIMAYGRLATQFELGQNTVLRIGGDYAQSGQGTKRQIASGDFKLEWRPNPQKYDLFEAGGEFLWTQQQGQLADGAVFQGNSSASSQAVGWYAYAQYRFGKTLQPGVRVNYTRGNNFQELDFDGNGDSGAFGRFTNNLWSYSAYLTLFASEFQLLRLQLSYLNGSQDIVSGKNSDFQAFLQWTVVLGSHKHEFVP